MVVTTKPRKRRQGKLLLERLHQAGIPASNCVRSQKTGEYTVDFDMANSEDFNAPGTDPSAVWAQRILEAFPQFEVTGCYDAIAHWRPHKPVLSATVFLRERETEATS